jgi:hypothetical protein
MRAKMKESRAESKAFRYRPGTHQKGEDTARRILEAAIEVFAGERYDWASTLSMMRRVRRGGRERQNHAW